MKNIDYEVKVFYSSFNALPQEVQRAFLSKLLKEKKISHEFIEELEDWHDIQKAREEMKRLGGTSLEEVKKELGL